MKTYLHREPRGAVSRRRRIVALVLTLPALALAACAKEPKAPPPPAEVKSVDDRFAIRVGERTVQMQVAVLQSELMQGLMFRRSMGADEGMLFVFSHPQRQSFWMRNTLIPLDIGYFDPSGELKEIAQMYPGDEHSVPTNSRNIQFCLEMNQGWFSRMGVKAGDKLDLKAVSDAIRARSFQPSAYNLP